MDNNTCTVNHTCNKLTGLCSFDIKDEDGDDVPCTKDCNDTDNSVGPSRPWFRDEDGDGHGVSSERRFACEQPDGFSGNKGDCDDTDNRIFPGALRYDRCPGPRLFPQADRVSNFSNTGDKYGQGLAIHNRTIVVGVSGFMMDVGALHILIQRDTLGAPFMTETWDEVHILLSPNATIGDFMGTDVDIHEDTIVAGGSTNRAWVFVRSNASDLASTWNQQTILLPSLNSTTGFGNHVAIAGDTIAVAARASGIVYVFARSGDVWSEVQILLNPTVSSANETEMTQFGSALDISDDGTTLIVGGFNRTQFLLTGNTSDLTSHVFVFERNASDLFDHTATLSDPSPTFFEFLRASFESVLAGSEIAIDKNNTIAALVEFKDLGDKELVGSVLIFVRDPPLSSDWIVEQELFASDAREGDSTIITTVGSVAISGNTVIRGVPEADTSRTSSTSCGAAYIYQRNGQDWSESQRLFPPNCTEADAYGRSAAVREGLTNSVLLVGDEAFNGVATTEGAVFLYACDRDDVC